MESEIESTQYKKTLEKYTKAFALKVTQAIVQSRQVNTNVLETLPEQELCNFEPPNTRQSKLSGKADWFNISITDWPAVTKDANYYLSGDIVSVLKNVFVIETSLQTSSGENMVLELWTIKILPSIDAAITSLSSIYFKMGITLKSLLTISRIVPAYKIWRMEKGESYKISYSLYEGMPDINVLGDSYRNIKVSELPLSFGNLHLSVSFRTNMSLVPTKEGPTPNMKMQCDHFSRDLMKEQRSSTVELNRPLKTGAFVDATQIRELHQSLRQKLLPELRTSKPPRFIDGKERSFSTSECVPVPRRREQEDDIVCSSSAPDTTHAIARNAHSDAHKYAKVMEFAFADGSPIADLASFYQDCVEARSLGQWTQTDVPAEPIDPEALSRQLNLYEEAVPEFDNMVASMYSDSMYGESSQ